MFNPHMYSLSLQVAYSSMAPLGFGTTFLNTPVEEFKIYLNESHDNQLTQADYETRWNVIQNIWLVGFLIGMILSPLMNDRYGRRVGLLSGNVCNLLMAIIQWAAIHFYVPSLLLIGRFFSSIASAITFQSIVLYLQEFPPSSKRGISSYTSDITYSFFSFVGMTLGTKQLLGDHLSALMAVQILICILSVVVTIRIHESPKYLLIRKNDEAAALNSIKFFHGPESTDSVQQFLEELKKEGQADASAAHSLTDVLAIFNDSALRKTVLLGLASVQMTLPLWTLFFNSTDLLLDLKASKFVSQWTSSGMVASYFFGTIIGTFLIDRVGRRSLFIPCSAISTACMGAVTGTFYLRLIPHTEWIAVGAMLLNGLVFGIGITSIAWFIAPELSPQRYRSLIQSIVAVLNTVESMTFNFSVMPMYRAFGPWIFLVLFCLISSICINFLYFELPETNGRPISEITEEMRKRSTKRRNVITATKTDVKTAQL